MRIAPNLRLRTARPDSGREQGRHERRACVCACVCVWGGMGRAAPKRAPEAVRPGRAGGLTIDRGGSTRVASGRRVRGRAANARACRPRSAAAGDGGGRAGPGQGGGGIGEELPVPPSRRRWRQWRSARHTTSERLHAAPRVALAGWLTAGAAAARPPAIHSLRYGAWGMQRYDGCTPVPSSCPSTSASASTCPSSHPRRPHSRDRQLSCGRMAAAPPFQAPDGTDTRARAPAQAHR